MVAPITKGGVEVSMRYKLLGRTGLRVSNLCLGTMTFGAADWGSDEEVSSRIYARYRDAGGNFLDTANEIYADGRSEETVAALTRGHRDEVVIGTKYTNAQEAHDPNFAGNQRKSLRRSLERSLRRLNTDYVDILWVHAWDFTVAPEEIMRALDDAVREGKALHIGVSNAPAWVVARCNTIAELRGWTSFAAIQVEYSLAQRSAEYELLPMAESLGLTALAWSPLAMGVLTGKYLNEQGEPRRLDIVRFRDADPASAEVARTVLAIAARRGCSPAALALAWVISRDAIPVFGARTAEQLADCLEAGRVLLEPEDLLTLDKVSEPPPTVPHNAIAGGRSIIFGGYAEQIDVSASAPRGHS